jgi:anti-sigma-K factor RskA
MTDTLPPPREDDDDVLAGEYVLGVLDHADRLALQARMQSDDVFAARVAAWEAQLVPLTDEIPPVTPPAAVFDRVEARLFPQPAPVRRAWRMWLVGAVTASVVAVAALMLLPPVGPGEVIASLSTADAALVYEARHDGSNLQVTRVAGTGAPAGQTHELWVIAPGATPVSLGLLGSDPLAVEYPRPPAGWVLAVSVEPAGGSTTGAPTGPVILTAELSI